jgi:sigma-E factor negative regulatory protein RseA
MKDKIEEQISALVDGELPAVEQELVFKRLCNDIELRRRWERYHLIRDALHHELPSAAGSGLADRVMAAIDNEPDLRSTRAFGGSVRGLAKPIAGLAIAASVAAMAVFGLHHLRETETTPSGAWQSAANHHNPGHSRVSGTRWNLQTPEVGSRLNSYLVNHNEYSSSTDLQGMMNYVRIAAYDSGQ